MERRRASRVLIAVSFALAALLTVLAVVQYRWATRVAEADVQRTKAHLDSAAALFARDFNLRLSETYVYLQNQGAQALDAGKPLQGAPRMAGDIYLAAAKAGEPVHLKKLQADGTFAESVDADVQALAQRLGRNSGSACSSEFLEDLPALVAPVGFNLGPPPVRPSDAKRGTAFAVTYSSLSNRCLIARFNREYLRDALFPELIRRTFGATFAADYDYAVVRRTDPSGPTVYGTVPRYAEVKQPLATLRMDDLLMYQARPPSPPGPAGDGRQQKVVIRGLFQQNNVVFGPRLQNAEFSMTGFWELEVSRKGGSLASAAESWRRQNVLLSIGVEAALLAAVAFLLLSTRRIQKLADQKMQFVAGVSHELRTPVSAISMLSRNQADGLVATPEQVKQYGTLIHQESQRLNEMVEQTLEFAGIQSGRRKPALREVGLRQVIADAVESRREELARAGFDVEVEIEPDLPAVRGDPQWLETAIGNLLSNAEKYANGRRWIRITAGYSQDHREVLVSVEDHGIGIDAADFEVIFEPFGRGRRAMDAQIPGTGIGLSLVRSTAEAHHGRVTFISEPDRGSTFTLHLPATP
jgi:signal transduction histidine kinase